MEFKRFTKKNLIINLLLVSSYLLWNKFIGYIRTEHYFLVIFWLLSYYFNDKSRRFILGFSIFIIFWIIYDSMRIVPNYEIAPVHIKEPYEFEKKLFGININMQILTPSEYFSINNNKFLDFLSGFFYINWMPVPIGFGIYLYIKDKYLFLKYSLAFLFINLLGFCIYYLYPAAPPWYVDFYGFDLKIVSGNRAGLVRFDELI
ncbi:MAG: phosphatase PAP2 family protein, partial [Bacteroidales bacterium]|nr:phosphatase PAP2 family protein [Bacteroidales bacterium]